MNPCQTLMFGLLRMMLIPLSGCVSKRFGTNTQAFTCHTHTNNYTMNKSKYIHFFGDQTAEGGVEKKHLLGGKGANLIEMTRLGIPVPPGFVITTEVCDLFFKNNKKLPKKIKQEIEHNLEKLENASRAKFGGVKNPL